MASARRLAGAEHVGEARVPRGAQRQVLEIRLLEAGERDLGAARRGPAEEADVVRLGRDAAQEGDQHVAARIARHRLHQRRVAGHLLREAIDRRGSVGATLFPEAAQARARVALVGEALVALIQGDDLVDAGLVAPGLRGVPEGADLDAPEARRRAVDRPGLGSHDAVGAVQRGGRRAARIDEAQDEVHALLIDDAVDHVARRDEDLEDVGLARANLAADGLACDEGVALGARRGGEDEVGEGAGDEGDAGEASERRGGTGGRGITGSSEEGAGAGKENRERREGREAREGAGGGDLAGAENGGENLTQVEVTGENLTLKTSPRLRSRAKTSPRKPHPG